MEFLSHTASKAKAARSPRKEESPTKQHTLRYEQESRGSRGRPIKRVVVPTTSSLQRRNLDRAEAQRPVKQMSPNIISRRKEKHPGESRPKERIPDTQQYSKKKIKKYTDIVKKEKKRSSSRTPETKVPQ